ncbi:MAG: hypothetical protein QNJ73_02850 [Gammaproteobacteria bacterium]|nr:hypothetical protein [Gammaproteobacteria bacterium]
MARGNAIRIIRQVTLGIVAAAFLVGTWLTQARVTGWQETLWVTIYPVVAGEQNMTSDYVDNLSAREFAAIRKFVEREAKRYGVPLADPVRIDIDAPTGMPPDPPTDGNPLAVMLWSLQLRWWAWRETGDRPGPEPDVKLFVAFHDPVNGVALPHSLGMKKSRIGIAHVFASRQMQGSNNVVIAHELLHILGATDKYGPGNLPVFPDGFAEPERQPIYPQRYAEIMGGRIPIDQETAEIPASLRQTRIGPTTAAEINWPATNHPPGT